CARNYYGSSPFAYW
nr:immunoglobulin heavy chain junction region [Mus musculus]